MYNSCPDSVSFANNRAPAGLKYTCELGVKLIEGLDGDELILTLVLQHSVHFTAHHQLSLCRYLELAIPVAAFSDLHQLALSLIGLRGDG